MIIHQVVNDYSQKSGGAERLARAIHVDLLRAGYEAALIGLIKQPDRHLKGALSCGLSSPYSLQAFFFLWSYCLKHIRPDDLVHVHLFPSTLYMALLKKMGICKASLVTTEHNTYNRRMGIWYGRYLDTFVYSAYTRIIAISEGTQEALSQWLPNISPKLQVINNGARMAFQDYTTRPNPKVVQLVTTARLHPQKNHDTALYALSKLPKELNFRWLIAGQGEEYYRLKELVVSLKLESKVRFLGQVEEVDKLLAEADIFLLPSRWEGFGLSVVEAMNASLPIVAGDVPGLRELVKGPRPTGLLVQPQEPDSIAQAIEQLIQSPQLRSELGKNGFMRSFKYCESQMLRQYRMMYNSF